MSWYKDKSEAWKEIIKETAEMSSKTELMIERDIIQSMFLYALSKENNDLLKDIVKTRFYENDYNTITTQLLYKYENYDDIIRDGLQKIIDSGIIKKCEENGVTK